MTLEERIRGALWYAVAQYPGAQPLPDDAYTDLARAVIAVLPTADVSDEQIMEALPLLNPTGIAQVRALLDAQRAADAAALEWETERRHRVEGWHRQEQERANTAVAEVEALRAENERLRAQPNYVITNPAVYAVRQAEADRDAYRARIDAVRALIEEPFTAADIRAALDGDA